MQQSFHWCEGCDRLESPPFFFTQEAIDTRNGTPFELVMVALPTTYGHTAVQIDFCPWCGVQLTKYRMFLPSDSKADLSEKHDYFDYRKRFVKQGRAGAPLERGEWEATLKEYNETEMLLPYAKAENAEGLFARKQVLRDRLCLGVVLHIVPPAMENETAEDYVKRLHQLREGLDSDY